MGGERIVGCGRGWRGFRSSLFLGLLALGNYFEPGAGGADQNVERGGVEGSAASAGVSIDEGRDFVFEQKREKHCGAVCGSAKLCDELLINFGCAAALGGARLHDASGEAGGYIQWEIFNGFVIRERGAVPTGGDPVL